MDVARLSPSKDTTGATIDQVRRLVELLPAEHEVPLFVFDAGYDPIGLAYGLAGTRPRSSPDPRPPGLLRRPAGPGEAPGHRQAGHQGPSTPSWAADEVLTAAHLGPAHPATGHPGPRYGTVTVTAWAHLHPKLTGRGRWAGHASPPIVKGPLIRVEVHHLPKPTARTKKTLWLFWSGPGTPDLALCWRAYLRRFDIEHTFRFAKNTLGWTSPSVCTPEQAGVDMAGGRDADPAPPRPRPRPGHPTPLGTTPQAPPAHPSTHPQRIPPTSCPHRHAGQSTENHDRRSRTTQGPPKTAPYPLPGIERAA